MNLYCAFFRDYGIFDMSSKYSNLIFNLRVIIVTEIYPGKGHVGIGYFSLTNIYLICNNYPSVRKVITLFPLF